MKKTEVAHILIICGDPGGAHAVAPVVKKLLKIRSVRVQVYAYFKAVTSFKKINIPVIELENEISLDEIKNLLIKSSPDLIMVGTSFNQFEFEKKFILISRDLNIPSLAVLDFWSYYSKRFSRNESDLEFLTDKVAIMDELAYLEMREEGFPPDRLTITGQPAFDRLKNKRSNFSAKDKSIVRAEIGIKTDQSLVLFISQPFSKLFGVSAENPLYPGYDEKSILNELLRLLNKLIIDHDIVVSLGIVPHLREEDSWWEKVGGDRVHIFPADKFDFDSLVMVSNIVTGMTSTKLYEAHVLGSNTFSLQMEAIPSKRFDMERLGINRNIFTIETLIMEIETALIGANKLAKAIEVEIKTSATNNVLNLIFEMLDMKKSERMMPLNELRMEVL